VVLKGYDNVSNLSQLLYVSFYREVLDFNLLHWIYSCDLCLFICCFSYLVSFLIIVGSVVFAIVVISFIIR